MRACMAPGRGGARGGAAIRRPVPPVLQLDARPAAVHAECTHDVSWRLGERQAEVRAIARLTAPGGDLVLIDWQIPAGVQVTDVTEVGRREGSARVRQWGGGDGHVQVWLDRPAREVSLQLTGWVGWWASRRFAARLGPLLLFFLYAIAMAALFLVATVIYLVIEHVYRVGRS